MDTLATLFDQIVVSLFEQLDEWLGVWMPKVFMAVLIVGGGWVIALLASKIVAKILRALGVDVIAERTGLVRFLERGGVHTRPSLLLGRGLYWVILFSALIMAFYAVEFRAGAELLERALRYIPRILVALAILALGVFLANFLGEFVRRSAQIADLPFASWLGYLTRFGVLLVSAVTAWEQLALAVTRFLEFLLGALLVASLLGILVFLIVGKDVIVGMLMGQAIRRELRPGDRILVDDLAGEIVSIDLVTTKLAVDDHLVYIPNARLARTIIRKHLSASERDVSSEPSHVL
ncbi:MAG: hypothetical protein D6690_04025 [Nitrospirae bacterium]|nr:MAG: hypothetical protein D6690_04025 [Nitrospirota bacterium]